MEPTRPHRLTAQASPAPARTAAAHPARPGRTARVIAVAGLAATAALAGCASTPRLGDVPAAQLGDRTIAVRTGSTPSFYADTSGRRFFGMIGVVAMMVEGNRLVEDYGLEDPAVALSRDLAASLTDAHRLRPATTDRADLILDVKTINWDFRPVRRDPGNLYVVYAARMTLTDARTGRVLAEGKCRSRRDGTEDVASLDTLLADDARQLRAELHDAQRQCAQYFRSDALHAVLTPATTAVAPLAARSTAPATTPR